MNQEDYEKAANYWKESCRQCLYVRGTIKKEGYAGRQTKYF